MLEELCWELAADLSREELRGKTVTLKLKTTAFEVRTRAQSLARAVGEAAELGSVARELLETAWGESGGSLSLRLMGVRLSSFVRESGRVGIQAFLSKPGRSESACSTEREACPVCGEEGTRRLSSEEQSLHVEECLSKAAIRDLLASEDGGSMGVDRPPSVSVAKKRPSASLPHNSKITKFFQPR